MTNPSEQTTTNSGATTIDPAEVAHFEAMAAEWWDPRGRFAPLHRMNPTRADYLRDQAIRHFKLDGQSATPLKNVKLLDVGCGGGLLSEAMAKMGANVCGIDAGLENIKMAALHARQGGLEVDYSCHSAEEMAAIGAKFDMVVALEIIEHVADVQLFYQALTQLVRPGGLLVLSTLNRTPKSYALAIVGAEMVLRWLPRGTHDWNKFIKPSEMAAALRNQGLKVADTTGLCFHPLTWSFSLNSKDLDMNYLMTAEKAA